VDARRYPDKQPFADSLLQRRYPRHRLRADGGMHQWRIHRETRRSCHGIQGHSICRATSGSTQMEGPVAMADGNQVYDATEFGYVSYQTEWESEGASVLPKSEDCLTLNVWHSINGGSEKKPVIVFIHGGDYA